MKEVKEEKILVGDRDTVIHHLFNTRLELEYKRRMDIKLHRMCTVSVGMGVQMGMEHVEREEKKELENIHREIREKVDKIISDEKGIGKIMLLYISTEFSRGFALTEKAYEVYIHVS